MGRPFTKSMFIYCMAVHLVTALAATGASADEAYRWTDAKGRIVYGENPPKNATNVQQIKGRSFSRYSSSKLLKAHGYKDRPALRSAQPVLDKEVESVATSGTRQDQRKPIDELIPAAQLEAQPVNVLITESGEVASCTARIINVGNETAGSIRVSFSFADGTLVPGDGPEQIVAGESAQYQIPASRLPVKLGPALTSFPDGSPDPNTPPEVIFDFVSQPTSATMP